MRKTLAILSLTCVAATAAVAQNPGDFPARPGVPATTGSDDFVVASGTKVLLRLRNAVDTRHSAPGDRLYLETASPIFVNSLLVIPQGSYVIGTVAETQGAGKVKGKAMLNIRFDSITLPNGVTRDFRSRVASTDGAQVDQEGRIKGDSGKGNDAKTMATATTGGAVAGSIAGAVNGTPMKGLGIGSAAGAAAGLVGVLMTRGPEVTLRAGASVEMVLDRDLRFTTEELTRRPR